MQLCDLNYKVLLSFERRESCKTGTLKKKIFFFFFNGVVYFILSFYSGLTVAISVLMAQAV